MNTKTVEKLVEMGAKEWHKGSMNRLYMNGAMTELVGLYVERYKTGNISYAELNGEKISNSEGYRIINAAERLYIDLDTMKICGGKIDPYYIDMFVKAITDLDNLITAQEEKSAAPVVETETAAVDAAENNINIVDDNTKKDAGETPAEGETMKEKYFSVEYFDPDFNGYQKDGAKNVEDALDDLFNLGAYHFEEDGKLYPSKKDEDMVDDGDEWKLINPAHVFLFDAVIDNANPTLKAAWDKRFSEMIEWGETAHDGDTFDMLGVEITCEIESDDDDDEE